MGLNFNTVPSDFVEAVKTLDPQPGDEFTDNQWAKEVWRRKIKSYLYKYRCKVIQESAITNIKVKDNEVQ